jgi:uroporphyrinogen-III decarboxylase
MTITVGAPRSAVDGARLVLRENEWYRVAPGASHVTNLWANTYSRDSWDTQAVSSADQVERCVPVVSAESLIADGRFDLPRRIITELGQTHFTMTYLSPPFAATYDIVGFSGMMVMPLERPDLTEALLDQLYRRDVEWARACALAGFDGILLENCLVSADLISPRLFETFVYPWDCRFARALSDLGLRVVHYFCGDVLPRLPLLREMDVDCLAVEESKKGFRIPVGEVVAAVGDRMCVAGNVDATRVPGWSEEELDTEVSWQVQQAEGALGFVISTGSPFPTDAPLDTLIRFMSAGRRHAAVE